MHLLGTNLHLKRPASWADDRGVQALVHVELRHGDVVFESPWHRVPQRVHRAQRRVAILHRLHDDAHGDEVVDLREAFALVHHLLVDGIQMLRTAHDLADDVDLLHLVVQRVDHFAQVLLALGARLGDHAADLLVLVGFEVVEGKVLKLPLHRVDAQAVRDGGVNLERLARLEDAAILLERRERAHVVQAVGQLDHDDADVFAHGDEHLADGGRLLVRQAFHLDARNLGDAVDERGHVLVELGCHVLVGDVGVLDRVVKKRSAQRLAVHAQVR